MHTSHLYQTDFYGWTQEQVTLLKAQEWDRLDTVNLIEEIESLGRKERQELRNRLGVLLGHLLKWQFQPDKRSNSWLGTIREQRVQIRLLLQDSPRACHQLGKLESELLKKNRQHRNDEASIRIKR